MYRCQVRLRRDFEDIGMEVSARVWNRRLRRPHGMRETVEFTESWFQIWPVAQATKPWVAFSLE
jgi:hypothetical protein